MTQDQTYENLILSICLTAKKAGVSRILRKDVHEIFNEIYPQGSYGYTPIGKLVSVKMKKLAPQLGGTYITGNSGQGPAGIQL